MTVFAPSDHYAITIPADGGRGCGLEHRRPVGPDGEPVQPWGLTCAICEDWLLANDDRWVKDILDIKPTFDEEKASKRLELTGAKDQAALMTAALAQLAGFSAGQLPPSVQRMIAGVRPHVPLTQAQMECPLGHAQQAGQKFCGQCGSPMAGTVAAASITAGAAA